MLQDIGCPFTGNKLQRVKDFLAEGGLSYDNGIEATICLLDESFQIAATGSMQDNVLKCILVSEKYQGEGLVATLLTGLVNLAYAKGRNHIFIFTKPHNQPIFASLGFYEVARTQQVLLLENTKNGIKRFVASLEHTSSSGPIGSIVCNCNPFTNGHLYLIEKAAAQCEQVHVFILSEDKSVFPADVRLRLARHGTAHIPNVLVHPTADYLISSATFPTYFIKDKANASQVNCELDFTIFRDHFATPLGITARFVGTEPLCPITSAYNQQMHSFFHDSKITIVELPRHTLGQEPISASRVRTLLAQGRREEAFALVPNTTRMFLEKPEGEAIIQRLSV